MATSTPQFDPRLPGRVQAAAPRAVNLTTPSIGQTPAPDTSGVAGILREVLSGVEQLGQIDKQRAAERLADDAMARARTDQERESIKLSMAQLQKDAAARDVAYTLQMPDHLDTITAASDAKIASIEATLPEGETLSSGERAQIQADEINQQFADSFDFRTSLKKEIARKTGDADAAQVRENYLRDQSMTLGEHFSELRDMNAEQYTDVIMRNAYLGEMLKHETLIVKEMQKIQFEDAEASQAIRIDEELNSSLNNGFVGFFSLPKLSEGETRTPAFVIEDAMRQWAQTKYGKEVDSLSPSQTRDMQRTVFQKAFEVLSAPSLDLGLSQRQQIAASFEEIDLPDAISRGLPQAMETMDAIVIAQNNERTSGEVDIISNQISVITTVEEFLAMNGAMGEFIDPESDEFASVKIGTNQFGAPVFAKVSSVQFKTLSDKWTAEQTKWAREAEIRAVNINGGNAGIGKKDWPITDNIYAKMIRPVAAGGEGLSRTRGFKKMIETYGRNAISETMVQEINSQPFSEGAQMLDTLVQSDPNILNHSTIFDNLSDEYRTIFDLSRFANVDMTTLASMVRTAGLNDTDFKTAVSAATRDASKLDIDRPGWWIFESSVGQSRESRQLLVSAYTLQRALGFNEEAALDKAREWYERGTIRVSVDGRLEDIVPLPIDISQTSDANGNLFPEAVFVRGPAGEVQSQYDLVAEVLSAVSRRRNYGVQTKFDLQNPKLSADGTKYLFDVLDTQTLPGLSLKKDTIELPRNTADLIRVNEALKESAQLTKTARVRGFPLPAGVKPLDTGGLTLFLAGP